MTDVDTMNPYRRRALKGWARRRLNAFLKAYRNYIGSYPEYVTVWAEDFDLLGGADCRTTLVRGRDRL